MPDNRGQIEQLLGDLFNKKDQAAGSVPEPPPVDPGGFVFGNGPGSAPAGGHVPEPPSGGDPFADLQPYRESYLHGGQPGAAPPPQTNASGIPQLPPGSGIPANPGAAPAPAVPGKPAVPSNRAPATPQPHPQIPGVPRSAAELPNSYTSLRDAAAWWHKRDQELGAEVKAYNDKVKRAGGLITPSEGADLERQRAVLQAKKDSQDELFHQLTVAGAGMDQMAKGAPIGYALADISRRAASLASKPKRTPSEEKAFTQLSQQRDVLQAMQEFALAKGLRADAIEADDKGIRFKGDVGKQFLQYFNDKAQRAAPDDPLWSKITTWIAPLTTEAMKRQDPQNRAKYQQIVQEADRRYPQLPNPYPTLAPKRPDQMTPDERRAQLANPGYGGSVLDQLAAHPGDARSDNKDAAFKLFQERNNARDAWIHQQMAQRGVFIPGDSLEPPMAATGDALTWILSGAAHQITRAGAGALLERFAPGVMEQLAGSALTKEGFAAASQRFLARYALRGLPAGAGLGTFTFGQELGHGKSLGEAARAGGTIGLAGTAGFGLVGAAAEPVLDAATKGIATKAFKWGNVLEGPEAAAKWGRNAWMAGKVVQNSVETGLGLSGTGVGSAYLSGVRDPFVLEKVAKDNFGMGALFGLASFAGSAGYGAIKQRLADHFAAAAENKAAQSEWTDWIKKVQSDTPQLHVPNGQGGVEVYRLWEMPEAKLDEVLGRLNQAAKDGVPGIEESLLKATAWKLHLQNRANLTTLNDLPTEQRKEWADLWKTSAPKRQVDALREAQASAQAAGDPATAALLEQAVQRYVHENIIEFRQARNPGERDPFVQRIQEPSVWRQLTPEQQQMLPPDARRALLIQDAVINERLGGYTAKPAGQDVARIERDGLNFRKRKDGIWASPNDYLTHVADQAYQKAVNLLRSTKAPRTAPGMQPESAPPPEISTPPAAPEPSAPYQPGQWQLDSGGQLKVEPRGQRYELNVYENGKKTKVGEADKPEIADKLAGIFLEKNPGQRIGPPGAAPTSVATQPRPETPPIAPGPNGAQPHFPTAPTLDITPPSPLVEQGQPGPNGATPPAPSSPGAPLPNGTTPPIAPAPAAPQPGGAPAPGAGPGPMFPLDQDAYRAVADLAQQRFGGQVGDHEIGQILGAGWPSEDRDIVLQQLYRDGYAIAPTQAPEPMPAGATPAAAPAENPQPHVTPAAPADNESHGGGPTFSENPDFHSTFPPFTPAAIQENIPAQLDADHNDPSDVASLHEGAMEEIGGYHREAAQLRTALETGKNPHTGRPLTPKQRKEIDADLKTTYGHIRGLLDEYENLFGAPARQAFGKHVFQGQSEQLPETNLGQVSTGLAEGGPPAPRSAADQLGDDLAGSLDDYLADLDRLTSGEPEEGAPAPRVASGEDVHPGQVLRSPTTRARYRVGTFNSGAGEWSVTVEDPGDTDLKVGDVRGISPKAASGLEVIEGHLPANNGKEPGNNGKPKSEGSGGSSSEGKPPKSEGKPKPKKKPAPAPTPAPEPPAEEPLPKELTQPSAADLADEFDQFMQEALGEDEGSGPQAAAAPEEERAPVSPERQVKVARAFRKMMDNPQFRSTVGRMALAAATEGHHSWEAWDRYLQAVSVYWGELPEIIRKDWHRRALLAAGVKANEPTDVTNPAEDQPAEPGPTGRPGAGDSGALPGVPAEVRGAGDGPGGRGEPAPERPVASEPVPADGGGSGSGRLQPAGSEGAAPGPGVPGEPAGEPDRAGEPAERGSARSRESEPDVSPGLDYRITPDDPISEGGKRTRYKQNVAAVKLLKAIEERGTPATPEEQKVLVRYAGWGGLAQEVFNTYNQHRTDEWRGAFQEVEQLLTKDEWQKARSSTRNAHYTSREIIEAMWEGLRRLGIESLTQPRILEPATGIGHFFGLMPPELRSGARLFGVELDNLTARMAQQLYQTAQIENLPYQETDFPAGFFDVVISNVPFDSKGVKDPAFANPQQAFLQETLHDYFFGKALDHVRPGGIVAFITSDGTLDKKNPRVREYLASKADFVGAYRLPNTAFAKNAFTEVTTDIIFLRKRAAGDAPNHAAAWTGTTQIPDPRGGEELTINEYFAAHPEAMLGRMERAGTQYSAGDQALVPFTKGDGRKLEMRGETKTPEGLASELAAAMSSPDVGLPESALKPAGRAIPERHVQRAREGVKPNALYIEGEKVLRRVGREAQEENYGPDRRKRLADIIGVRDAYVKLLDMQPDASIPDEQTEAQRALLNQRYDAFVAKWGYFHDPINRNAYKGDPDLPTLLSLERWDPKAPRPAAAAKLKSKAKGPAETPALPAEEVDEAERSAGEGLGAPTKAAVFQERTVWPRRQITHADLGADALKVTLSERGRLDWELMERLTGRTQGSLVEELGELLFNDPEKGWTTRDDYLSGNVVRKLAEARKAAALDPVYARNVPALEAVQPEPLLPHQIHARLGTPWIETEDYAAFVGHILGCNPDQVKVSYIPPLATFKIDAPESAAKSARGLETWGTSHMDALKLIDLAMNGKQPEVRIKTREGTYVDRGETDRAITKQDELKEEFTKWLWDADPARAVRLAAKYNSLFNNFRQRRFDGSHLDTPDMPLPGKSAAIDLRQHQKDAAWRVVVDGNTLLAHEVGTGKTFTMITAAMELRRLGIARKSMLVVPNHLPNQMRRDILALYPGANILVPAKTDFETKNRQRLMAQVASENWDLVVVPFSQFGLLPVHPDTEKAYVEKQIEMLEWYYREAGGDESKKRRNKQGKLVETSRDPTVKELSRQLDKARERLAENLKRSRDAGVTWEQLGVDALFVDEADEFKNLGFATKKGRLKGVSTANSKRADDLFMKSRHMQETNGGRLVFSTGTPISNSLVELWTMQRYLMWDELERSGMAHFDAWSNTFGSEEPTYEVPIEGKGLKKVTRMRFGNVPELISMFRRVADIQRVTDPDLQRLVDQTRSFMLRPEGDGLNFKSALERVVEQQRAAGESVPENYYLAVVLAQRPTLRTGAYQPIVVEADDTYLRYVDGLAAMMERFRKDRQFREQNPAVALQVTTAGRKASIDMRMVDPNAEDDPDSKVNALADNVARIWSETAATKGTQVIFCDVGVPSQRGESHTDPLDRLKVGEAVHWRDGVRDREGFILQVDRTRDQALVSEGYKDEDGDKQLSGREFWVNMHELYLPDEEIVDESLFPKTDFNLYEEIRQKLHQKHGIPLAQIRFVQEYGKDQKEQLFDAVRAGDVRIVLGSTPTMGAGTNIQDKLVAAHHLDVPWRPRDLEQRDGRILRQGNQNPEISIFTYIRRGRGGTYGFDTVMWQIIEAKRETIDRVMKGDPNMRDADDATDRDASAEQMKAIASGDPRIIRMVELKADVDRLRRMRSSYESHKHEIRSKLTWLPGRIDRTDLELTLGREALEAFEGWRNALEAERQAAHSAAVAEASAEGKKPPKNPPDLAFRITIGGKVYEARKEAGEELIALAVKLKEDEQHPNGDVVNVGEYGPFKLALQKDTSFGMRFMLSVDPRLTLNDTVSPDPVAAIRKLDNELNRLPDFVSSHELNLTLLRKDESDLQAELHRGFSKEEEFQQKAGELSRLEQELAKEKKETPPDDPSQIDEGDDSRLTYDFAAPSASAPSTSRQLGTPGAAATATAATQGPVRQIAQSVINTLAPASASPDAELAAMVMREKLGRLAQAHERAEEALKDAKRTLGKLNPDENYAFIDRIEHAQPQPTPELQKIADALRDILDGRRKAVQALGNGKLQSYYEHYFPHVWEQPQQAGNIFAQIMGKRPLEGSKSFLKKRSIPFFADGLAAGLKPISDNAVELVLLKVHEMDRYLMAHRALDELKARGLMRYVRATAQKPTGYTQIADPIGTVYGNPNIPITEAYDKTLVDALTAFGKNVLNIQFERKLKIGGQGRWGYASLDKFNPRADAQIVTKFAGPEFIVTHEIGHHIDAQYHLAHFLLGDKQTKPYAHKKVMKELRSLARLRYQSIPQGNVQKAFIRYVMQADEKVANLVHAMVHAPHLVEQLAPTTLRRMRTFLNQHPELKPLFNDIKPGLEIGTNDTTVNAGGIVIRGHYWMPERAAAIINNYLAPGLRNNPVFGAYMGLGNLLNGVQLGLSAFHLTFVSMDAAISKMALGINRAAYGEVGGALDMAKAAIPLYAPIENWIRGNQLMREYLRPGSDQRFAELADALARGGGRVRMDSFYKNSAPEALLKALKRVPHEVRRGSIKGAVGETGRALWQTIPAFVELAAYPIMELVVPRMKLGVFADLAGVELRRLGTNASPEEITQTLQRVWDSVDNRMGQMVYDNLFWHRAVKDLGLASVRSLGWNLGTIREIGGAAVDVAQYAGRFVPRKGAGGGNANPPGGGAAGGGSGGSGGSGGGGGAPAGSGSPGGGPRPRRPLFTYRVSYVIAMTFLTGLIGAILQYLYTGKGPEDARDYFFPRTGGTKPNGKPERIAVPGYMKDVWAYGIQPGETVAHKLHPLIGLLADFWQNHDFQNTEIRNADDPVVKQAQDVLSYLAGAYEPIALRNRRAIEESGRGPADQARSFFGLVDAPAYVDRTPAEAKLQEYLDKQMPKGPISRDQEEERQMRQDLVSALRGQKDSAGNDLAAAVQAGKLDGQDLARLLTKSTRTPLQAGFILLPLKPALRVYELANPHEREQLLPYLARKLAQLGKLPASEIPETVEKIQELLGPPPGVEAH